MSTGNPKHKCNLLVDIILVFVNVSRAKAFTSFPLFVEVQLKGQLSFFFFILISWYVWRLYLEENKNLRTWVHETIQRLLYLQIFCDFFLIFWHIERGCYFSVSSNFWTMSMINFFSSIDETFEFSWKKNRKKKGKILSFVLNYIAIFQFHFYYFIFLVF